MNKQKGKVYDQSGKEVETKSSHIIRRTQYVQCQQLFIVNKFCLLIRFIGIADFNLPLIEKFKMMTFFNTDEPSRQLGIFLKQAWQALKRANQQKKFETQFWGNALNQNTERLRNKVKPAQNQTMQQKIDEIIQNARELIQIFAQFQSNRNFLEALNQKIKNNLKKFVIVPSSFKIGRLKRICGRLKQTQKNNFRLFTNKQKNDYYFVMQGCREGTESTDKIITVEALIDQFTKQYDKFPQINERSIENFLSHLLDQICTFEEKMRGYFSKHREGSNYTLKQNKIPPLSSYVNLEPYNTIIALKKMKVAQLQKEQKSNSNQEVYIICDINYDISQIILREFGILFDSPNQKFKRGPTSLEDYMIFYAKVNTPINQFDFQPQLLKYSKDNHWQDQQKTKEVKSIILWLMIGSVLYSKLLHRRSTSIYQQQRITSKDLFQSILNKNNSLGQQIGSWLILYGMLMGKQLDSLSFTFMQWQDCLGYNCTKKQTILTEVYQKHKYGLCRLILKLFQNLYFGAKNIKYFIEKTNYFGHMDNIGRYILLYLMLKYGQIIFQQTILGVFGFIEDDLSKKQYQLKKLIDRYTNIYNKIQQKIYQDYQKRADQKTLQYKQQNEKYFQILKQLKGKKIGSYCQLEAKQGQKKQISQLASEIRGIIIKIIQSNKLRPRQLSIDQIPICCKNENLVRIFMNVDIKTYSEMVGLEYVVQGAMNNLPQQIDFWGVRKHFQKQTKDQTNKFKTKITFSVFDDHDSLQKNRQSKQK